MVELQDQADGRGMKISPTLSDGKKNYLIDIDGTICEDIPNEEPERMATAEPFENVVDVINGWYKDGHIITFFTSRTDEHSEVTEKWLDAQGYKYHGVLYNKPRGGNYHWVDNHIVRATRYNSKFTDFITKTVEVEVFDD
ncbi:MAG: phosphoheptose isomerase [Euryarchaeota archaeon]|jgi:hypothetical protein|nr:phosphoheptose isomerase [Euryarchaeota archaeon]MBT3970591.1 phosphoheptose isomerase [Euryarchaeota archaeon]MBT4407126.1 phosphoheptose isomerase [Euryarchaeota archaeon]MBT6645782.1 phosphoheptose isomerase [Euryarchaeota archaeon]